MGVVSASSMRGSCQLVCREWLRDLLAVFFAGGSQLRVRECTVLEGSLTWFSLFVVSLVEGVGLPGLARSGVSGIAGKASIRSVSLLTRAELGTLFVPGV